MATGGAPETTVLDAAAVSFTPAAFLHVQMSILDIRRVGDTMYNKVIFGHVGGAYSAHTPEKNVHKLLGQLLPFPPGKNSGRTGEFFNVQRMLAFGHSAWVPNAVGRSQYKHLGRQAPEKNFVHVLIFHERKVFGRKISARSGVDIGVVFGRLVLWKFMDAHGAPEKLASIELVGASHAFHIEADPVFSNQSQKKLRGCIVRDHQLCGQVISAPSISFIPVALPLSMSSLELLN